MALRTNVSPAVRVGPVWEGLAALAGALAFPVRTAAANWRRTERPEWVPALGLGRIRHVADDELSGGEGVLMAQREAWAGAGHHPDRQRGREPGECADAAVGSLA